THPTTTTHQAWRDKMQRAQRSAHANYAFFFGATNDNLETLRELDPTTTCGIKIFMGSSTGNMLVDNSDILEQIFASTPLLIATHCEDTPTIQNNFKRAQERYGVDIPIALHPHIRSEEACFLSSSRAVELAKKHGTRLHVLHISTARELSLFENRPLDQKHITAEACIHHMFFCDEDYARLGTQIKCNPAIKTKRDRDAILNAIRNDVIDVIATDHAPHTWEEKQAPYPSAPSGLPLIQHSLLSLLEHVQRQRLTLEQVVQKTSHRVADLFRIRDRGFIREGYWADLVLVDPNQTTTVTQENIAYACGWSPFLGHTFPASIDATIVSGALAYYEGKLQPKPRGQALTFHAEPGSA
ncbi:MAG: dihydroorotase, partial [Myxococcota bacterium]